MSWVVGGQTRREEMMFSRFDSLRWPPWSPVRPQWLSPEMTGRMSPSRRSLVRRNGLCSWSGRRWQRRIWLCWCRTAGRTWAAKTQSGSALGPALSPLELFRTGHMAFIFVCLFHYYSEHDKRLIRALVTGLNTHHWNWAVSRCRGSGWCW